MNRERFEWGDNGWLPETTLQEPVACRSVSFHEVFSRRRLGSNLLLHQSESIENFPGVQISVGLNFSTLDFLIKEFRIIKDFEEICVEQTSSIFSKRSSY